MFVKLFTQILDSSIADNRRLRHFFTDLLLCADPQGYVMMTDSAISRRIGATIDEVEWGLGELSRPDARSKTPDYEGRRIEKLEGTGYGWRIVNFESYKALKSADDLREKTKERVRKCRENKKKQGEIDDVTQCNADVTPGNACNTMKRQRKMHMKKEEENNEQREIITTGSNDTSNAQGKGTIDQLRAFAVEIGLPASDGESMFHHWESNGWKNGSSPSKNWRSGILKWKSQGWLPSQKNQVTLKPKTTTAEQYGI
jgi:hypothetical protein